MGVLSGGLTAHDVFLQNSLLMRCGNKCDSHIFTGGGGGEIACYGLSEHKQFRRKCGFLGGIFIWSQWITTKLGSVVSCNS